jgi:hypothetical protein
LLVKGEKMNKADVEAYIRAYMQEKEWMCDVPQVEEKAEGAFGLSFNVTSSEAAARAPGASRCKNYWDVLVYVKKNPEIRVSSLKLSGSGICGLEVVGAMMGIENTLTTLDLSKADISDEDVMQIVFLGLRSNHTLTTLLLQCRRLGYASTASLADMLKENHTLTTLLLGGHLVSDESIALLADALKINQTLTSLSLSSLGLFGNAGAISLANALRENHALTFLWLTGQSIGDEGAAALAEALKVNQTLTKLWINAEYLCDEGAELLISVLRDHKTRLEELKFPRTLWNEYISEDTKNSATKLSQEKKNMRIMALEAIKHESEPSCNDAAASCPSISVVNESMIPPSPDPHSLLSKRSVEALTSEQEEKRPKKSMK